MPFSYTPFPSRVESLMRMRTPSLLLVILLCANPTMGGEDAFQAFNQAFGMQLFGPKPLWRERASAVAPRLGLERVSDARDETIWSRSLPRVGEETAVSLRLFADDDGRVAAVEINLLNKGDFFRPASAERFIQAYYARDANGKPPRPGRSRLRRDM